MRKLLDNQPRSSKFKTRSVVLAILFLVGSRILSLANSRLDDWGNKLIDLWLAQHQGNMIVWVLQNPLNLITALSMVILLIFSVDWYLQKRKQGRLSPQLIPYSETELMALPIQSSPVASPPPVKPLSPTTTGEINIFHNIPQRDVSGNPIEFKFTLDNGTNISFSDCAVYVNEIAYKTKKSKQWEIVSDLISEKPLLWDDLMFSLDGRTRIEPGHKKAFILARANTDKHEPRTYKYDLVFYKFSALLPREDGVNHRILIHFQGNSILGVKIDKKYFVFLREKKPGIREYERIEPATT